MTEQNDRLEVFRTYTQTPHGELDRAVEVFNEARKDGPFFQRFVSWVHDTTKIRDHKVTSTVAAVLSPHMEDRNIGLALYRQLPVRLAAQVIRYIKESGHNVPQSLVTETRRYLRDLQVNDHVFDRVGVTNREDLKYLFATLHIAPSPRTQRILFEGDYPEDTVWWAIREAEQSDDPAEKARLVVQYGIPGLVATSLLEGPEGIVALVNSMTPAQVQNNLQSLKEAGAYENAELKAMIVNKLKQGAKDARYQSAKRSVVSEDAVDEEISQVMEEVREQVLSTEYTITRRTLLAVDVSSSMSEAIRLATQIGPDISQAAQNVHVVCFNSAVTELRPGETLRDWENAFSRIPAMGSTSFGAPLKWALDRGIYVEQVMFLTDQQETHYPLLEGTLREYVSELGPVHGIIVQMDNKRERHIEKAFHDVGQPYDVYQWTSNDYTAKDNLLRLLSGKSMYDILDEIMSHPVPRRLPN